jgi:segregation and condensation protein B
MKEVVEALLFAAQEPLSSERLSKILGISPEAVAELVSELNAEYEATGRTFRVERIARGYELYTLPRYGNWLKLLTPSRDQRLSRASLETLAIIAYNQPITRPQIEAIRGVDSSAPLTTLLSRRLIQSRGRAPSPGRPILYATARDFLRYFGLADLKELPRKEELEEFLRSRDGKAETSGEG